MKGYREITNAEELSDFMEKTVSFHDSMVKELQMINRGYVMEDKSMDMGHRFDTRILFQSQWDPIAFELVCINTKRLKTNDPGEFFGAGGKFKESPSQLIELRLDQDTVIRCEKLFYKLCPEFIGNSEHLGSEVPVSNMASAEVLENNWRQCGNCSNAWEVLSSRKIATCPSCNQVTCLKCT